MPVENKDTKDKRENTWIWLSILFVAFSILAFIMWGRHKYDKDSARTILITVIGAYSGILSVVIVVFTFLNERYFRKKSEYQTSIEKQRTSVIKELDAIVKFLSKPESRLLKILRTDELSKLRAFSKDIPEYKTSIEKKPTLKERVMSKDVWKIENPLTYLGNELSSLESLETEFSKFTSNPLAFDFPLFKSVYLYYGSIICLCFAVFQTAIGNSGTYLNSISSVIVFTISVLAIGGIFILIAMLLSMHQYASGLGGHATVNTYESSIQYKLELLECEDIKA